MSHIQFSHEQKELDNLQEALGSDRSQNMPGNVQETSGHRVVQEGSMTYIVIVNKNTGQETKAQIPTAELLKHSEMSKMSLTSSTKGLSAETVKKMPPLELKAKTKSVIRSRGMLGADDVKLNFTSMGFDDYDSSSTAQSVFNDDIDKERSSAVFVKKIHDEGFSEPGSSTCPAASFQNPVTDEEDDPLLDLNSPLPTSLEIPSKTNITPAMGHIDLSSNSSCSGYYSDNSSFLSPSYTPSPSTANSKYHAAQKVYYISPGTRQGMLDTLGKSGGHTSTDSPVTSLVSNLRNVAFFQSPSPMSSRMSSVDCMKDQSHSTSASPMSDCGIAIPTSTEKLMQLKTSTPRVTTIQSTPSTSATPLPPNITSIKSLNIKLPQMSQVPKMKTIVVQRKSSTAVDPGAETRPMGHSVEKVDGVVLHFNVSEKETVVQVTEDNDSQQSGPKEDVLSSSQESNQTEKDILNNSLTNMHWLEGIQGINEPESERQKPSRCEEPKARETNVTNPVQWRYLSPAEVAKIAKDCGRSKRPPFSYMTLIQMALNSREDKRMTLKEICRWIEETFPYYRFTAKPGWKNSIRHNLSLYSIFEREKTKKHGSYWTVRDDCPEKSKSLPSKDNYKKVSSPSTGVATMFPLMPTILHSSHGLKLPIPHSTATPTISVPGDGKKRGPQPILPRPVAYSSTPMQTYALIPIQNVPQGIQMAQGGTGQQPVILQVPAGQENKTVNLFPGIQENSDVGNKDKKLGQKHRYSNIAPKSSSSADNVSIVRQAWLNSQLSDTETERTASDAEIQQFKTEPVDYDDFTDTNSTIKKARLKSGLPTPKIYTRRTPPSRKTKTRRKQKLVPKERDLMQDSSDEESSKFIEGLEKELPTPVRNASFQQTENLKTSTPFKQNVSSPQLVSPIRGLTPLRSSGLLDSSFLDCLKDSDSDGGKAFVISPDVLAAKKASPQQLRGMNLSQLENFSFSFTPLKLEHGSDLGGGDHNQSLSKFLAEFPIDSGMMEDGDALPVDLSLNWSNVGQEPIQSDVNGS